MDFVANAIEVSLDLPVSEAKDSNVDKCKLLAAHAIVTQAIRILVVRPCRATRVMLGDDRMLSYRPRPENVAPFPSLSHPRGRGPG